MWALLLVLSLTLVTTVVVLVYQPEIIGLQQEADLTRTAVGYVATQDSLVGTADALGQTQIAVNMTAQANIVGEFSNQSTRAALNNESALLSGRETQSARDFAATQNAIAQENARQGTQAALDFSGTQSAFERQATQVELDYQGTQAALNQNATAVALGFSTAPPSAQDIIDSTPSPPPLFNEGFSNGLSAGLWNASSPTDWGLSADGLSLVALTTPAWLLTQNANFATYRADFRLSAVTPPTPSFYYVLLNLPASTDTNGVVLELFHDGAQVTAVSAFRVNRTQINAEESLSSQNLTAMQGLQTMIPAENELYIQVDVSASRLTVFINQMNALSIGLEAPLPAGALGVYLPQGAGVSNIAILR